MVTLTHRAERALLGALLLDPDQMQNARFVAAPDFTSPQHQAIFTAIAAGKDPALSHQQMRELKESCPRSWNAPVYAQMVAEASLRRQLAAHATRLIEDAGKLNHEIGRFTSATQPGHGAEAFPAHLLKLAHAMLRHSWGFDPEPGGVPAPGTEPPTPTSGGGERQAQQEEEVLADLIQHFWQNSDVLSWLPAEAFTSGPRREVYQAIATLARNGEPVDELTVDWQLARNRTAIHATSSTAGQAGPGGQEPGYVTKLAGLTVADGTATLTGHLLLNRHAAAQPHARPAHQVNGSHPGDQAVIMSQPARPPSSRPHPPRPAGPSLLQAPPGQCGQPPQPGPEPRP